MLNVAEIVKKLFVLILFLFTVEGVLTLAMPGLEEPIGFFYKLTWIIIFALFIHLAVLKRSVVLPIKKTLIFVLFILAMLSSLHYPSRILIAAFQFILTFTFFINVVMFSNIKISKVQLHQILKLGAVLSVIIAVIGLIEFIFPNQIKNIIGTNVIMEQNFAVKRGDMLASQSIFLHPGLYGWFMSFCFCISLAMALMEKSKFKYILTLLFFLALIVSLRRRSIIACTLISFIGVYIANPSIQKKIYSIIFTFAILVFFYLIFMDKINFLITDVLTHYIISDSIYGGPRIFLTQTSLEVASDYFPLGAGLGTYGSWMSRMFYSPVYYDYGVAGKFGLSPDNSIFLNDTFWPMLLGEIGFIGAFIYFLILFSIFIKLLRSFNRAGDIFVKTVLLAAILVFLEGGVESLSTPVFSKMPHSLFIGFVVGAAISVSRTYQKLNLSSSKPIN